VPNSTKQLDVAPFEIGDLAAAQAVAVSDENRVASRCPWRPLRAALMSFSTSASIRYSRDRGALLGGRDLDLWTRCPLVRGRTVR